MAGCLGRQVSGGGGEDAQALKGSGRAGWDVKIKTCKFLSCPPAWATGAPSQTTRGGNLQSLPPPQTQLCPDLQRQEPAKGRPDLHPRALPDPQTGNATGNCPTYRRQNRASPRIPPTTGPEGVPHINKQDLGCIQPTGTTPWECTAFAATQIHHTPR